MASIRKLVTLSLLSWITSCGASSGFVAPASSVILSSTLLNAPIVGAYNETLMGSASAAVDSMSAALLAVTPQQNLSALQSRMWQAFQRLPSVSTGLQTLIKDSAVVAAQQLVSLRASMHQTFQTLIEYNETSLSVLLKGMMEDSSGVTAQRLPAIETVLQEKFLALPKNDRGLLGPGAVRYMIYTYFVREHGWLISGFELQGLEVGVSEIHEVKILQDRAPTIAEELLQTRLLDRGLTLADVVVIVALLERLITDEALGLLGTAYRHNRFSFRQDLRGDELHEVLTSYLLLIQKGTNSTWINMSTSMHNRMKQNLKLRRPNFWVQIQLVAEAAAEDFTAPLEHTGLETHLYSFENTSVIVKNMLYHLSRVQSTECQQMKADLMSVDSTGRGRLPLSRFYAKSQKSVFAVTESVDYLREIGALDESIPGAAQVRVANYVLGPSNCLAVSNYFSTCCANQCQSIMHEIEAKIEAPSATPTDLLSVVNALAFPQAHGSNLNIMLVEKLNSIAEHHSGLVPLQSRLFAQWLHYVFPGECPYPHTVKNTTMMIVREAIQAQISNSEREALARNASNFNEDMGLELANHMVWDDKQVLFAHSGPVNPDTIRMTVEIVAALEMLSLILLMTIALVPKVVRVARGKVKKPKLTSKELSLDESIEV